MTTITEEERAARQTHQNRMAQWDREGRWSTTAATWVQKAVAVLTYSPIDRTGWNGSRLLYKVMDQLDYLVRHAPLGEDFTESWEFEYTLKNAESIVEALHKMEGNTKLDKRIERLEQIAGRTPEEAAAFLAKAAELRAKRP